MRIRVIQHGDREFEADAEFAAPAIAGAISGESGEDVRSEIVDYTDTERSDIDRDEYVIVTGHDGTEMWSGWLDASRQDDPPPAGIAGRRELLDAGDRSQDPRRRELTEARDREIEASEPTPVQRLLALKVRASNDAGATDVRDYLRRLLAKVWVEEEDDPKRPFGNSGWQADVYAPMIAARLVQGRGPYPESLSEEADKLVCAAIDAMCRGEA
jgi:hypothetical protein